jgi:hypothetical protein
VASFLGAGADTFVQLEPTSTFLPRRMLKRRVQRGPCPHRPKVFAHPPNSSTVEYRYLEDGSYPGVGESGGASSPRKAEIPSKKKSYGLSCTENPSEDRVSTPIKAIGPPDTFRSGQGGPKTLTYKLPACLLAWQFGGWRWGFLARPQPFESGADCYGDLTIVVCLSIVAGYITYCRV